MTNIARLPLDTAAFDRLTANQRNANIAAERADWVRIARAVLRSPKYHPDDVLRDACAALQAWGDGFDHLTADAMIQVLNQRDRMRAHEIARRSVETPADVARPYWPQVAAIVLGFALAVVVSVVLP